MPEQCSCFSHRVPECKLIAGRWHDLAGIHMQRLKAVGFDGYLSIEYEGDPDNPLPQVQECVQVIQEVIDGL